MWAKKQDKLHLLEAELRETCICMYLAVYQNLRGLIKVYNYSRDRPESETESQR